MSLQTVSFLTIKWQDELRRLVEEGEADEYDLVLLFKVKQVLPPSHREHLHTERDHY